jgi:hypothetical protein
MKTQFTLLLAALFLFTTNCEKNEKLDYQYTNQPDTIKCFSQDINTALLKEAYYSFENDMKLQFAKNSGNTAQGYSIFINTISAGRPLEPTKVSSHSRKILEHLKNESGLWVNDNGTYHLNYESDLVTCLSDNIGDSNLQTTFKALVSTNSMNPKIFAAPLRTQIRNIQNNKFLGTFMALDMYYAQLMNVDFSNIEAPAAPEEAAKKWDKDTPPSASKRQ